MAVDMFLKMPPLKGESRDKKHGEEIDVLAWSWGAAIPARRTWVAVPVRGRSLSVT